MENDRFFANGFISDTMGLTDFTANEVYEENKKFSKDYPELMRQEMNQLDAKNQYRRTLMQTVNIIVAIACISGLLYTQK